MANPGEDKSEIDGEEASLLTNDQLKSDPAIKPPRKKRIQTYYLNLAIGAGNFIGSLVNIISPFLAPASNLLHAIMSAIPPFRLIFEALVGIKDIFYAVFIDKNSKFSRAAKIGFGLTSIAALILAYIYPPFALVIVAALIGIIIVKEGLALAQTVRVYRKEKDLLTEARLALQEARTANNQEEIQRLESSIATYEKQVKASAEKVRTQSIDLALGCLTLLGGILLVFPPTAIAGAAIILASAIIGVTYHLTVFIMKKREEYKQQKIAAENQESTKDENAPRSKYEFSATKERDLEKTEKNILATSEAASHEWKSSKHDPTQYQAIRHRQGFKINEDSTELPKDDKISSVQNPKL